MVLDLEQAEVDVAAGVLVCPGCAGRLRPWSWAPTRRVRRLDGSVVAVRPRRTRCAACRRTHVLLPSWCLPRRADTLKVVGAALAAHAAGSPRISAVWPVPCAAGSGPSAGGMRAGCTARASSTRSCSPLRSWARSRLSPPSSATRSPPWPRPRSRSAADSGATFRCGTSSAWSRADGYSHRTRPADHQPPQGTRMPSAGRHHEHQHTRHHEHDADTASTEPTQITRRSCSS